MRPIETLLLLSHFMALVALVIPLPAHGRRLRHLALVPLPVASGQLLLEGPRWQLVPAYALSALFVVVALLGRRSARRSANRWVKRLGVVLGALALTISIGLPEAIPVFRLPEPTGPFDVGTLTYHWADAKRPEVFTADPHDLRELMVQVWYPSAAAPSSPRAPYIDDAEIVAPALAQFIRLPGFALDHLRYVASNAIPAGRVADGQARYPVLLFQEGLGGYRQMSSFQVEELASHGYIVAAIDQPYVASAVVYSDGRVRRYDPRMDPPYFKPDYDPNVDPSHSAFLDAHLRYLAGDASFTLDRLTALNQDDPNGVLTGRLDLERIGLFGHSLGGIVGAEACRLETRLRACLLEDAFMPASVVRDGLTQPTMWITRDAETMRLERELAGGWPEPAITEHLTTMRAVYESLPSDGYYVQVPGMFHVDMNDAPLLSPLAPQLGLSGPIGGERAHQIVNGYSVAFFDRYLKGDAEALADGLADRYPEVRFESRRSMTTTAIVAEETD
jgi:predicted dienelactone hydrolase